MRKKMGNHNQTLRKVVKRKEGMKQKTNFNFINASCNSHAKGVASEIINMCHRKRKASKLKEGLIKIMIKTLYTH